MRRCVVALVQADAGLVEHVHHARELAAELAREADALRLAAAQRRARAIEREVVEPDVRGRNESRLVDLAERALGDALCAAPQSARRSNVVDARSRTVIAVTSAMLFPADEHGEGLGAEPLAARTRRRGARS